MKIRGKRRGTSKVGGGGDKGNVDERNIEN